jgi:large subunit ribosomal protein L22
MKATLTQYRQSPRKVRNVADLIRGKSIAVALTQLTFLPRRASLPLKKLLESAIANAKNSGESIEKLYVKSITVDGGVTMKRQMPRAFGRAFQIKKRTSHINIELGVRNPVLKSAAPTEEVKKEKTVKTKKVATKKLTKSEK